MRARFQMSAQRSISRGSLVVFLSVTATADAPLGSQKSWLGSVSSGPTERAPPPRAGTTMIRPLQTTAQGLLVRKKARNSPSDDQTGAEPAPSASFSGAACPSAATIQIEHLAESSAFSVGGALVTRQRAKARCFPSGDHVG